MSSRLLFLAAVGSVAALTMGCNGREGLAMKARTALTGTSNAAPAPPAPPPASPEISLAPPPVVRPVARPPAPMFETAPTSGGLGEQPLDTQPGPSTTTAAPILTTKNQKAKVRTPADENLPKWVPVKGRLTVVDSSDLAENLGLVPKGTTKKTDERISVADKLDEESAARAATVSDPSPRTWNFSVKSHVRTARR